MNAADKAIEEIRAVRHRISTEHGHDIAKYLASLRAEEKQHRRNSNAARNCWLGGARKAKNIRRIVRRCAGAARTPQKVKTCAVEHFHRR